MDKKVLLILILVLVFAGLLAVAAYKFLGENNISTGDFGGDANKQAEDVFVPGLEDNATEPEIVKENNSAGNNAEGQPANPGDDFQVQVSGVKAEGGGSISICFDKCGDGICQPENTSCNPSSTNCICPETPEECPEDCK